VVVVATRKKYHSTHILDQIFQLPYPVLDFREFLSYLLDEKLVYPTLLASVVLF
jgi:hypothetical protein